MNRHTQCVLCGLDDRHNVRIRLVDWKAPHDGKHFGHVPRCDKTEDCRARVIASGEQWEIRDPDFSLAQLIRGGQA